MLISGSLKEFRNPETGGYSEAQMRKDYESILRRYKLDVTPEGAQHFLINVVAPAFETGKINSDDDLEKIVIGNEPVGIMEDCGSCLEDTEVYYDKVLDELDIMISDTDTLAQIIQEYSSTIWEICVGAQENGMDPSQAAQLVMAKI